MAISNTSGFIQLNNSLPHFLLLYLKFFFLLNSVKGLVREPPMNTRYILLNVFDDALLSSKIAVVNKRIYAMAHTSLSQPEIRYFVYYECQQSQISAIPPLNHLSIFSSFFFSFSHFPRERLVILIKWHVRARLRYSCSQCIQ